MSTPRLDRDEDRIRDWLVERGHIKPEDRDTVAIRACRMPDEAGGPLDRDEAQCPRCQSPVIETWRQDGYTSRRYACWSIERDWSDGIQQGAHEFRHMNDDPVTCDLIAGLRLKAEERDRLRAERDEWRDACIHAKQQRDRAISRANADAAGFWHPDMDGPYPATTEETT